MTRMDLSREVVISNRVVDIRKFVSHPVLVQKRFIDPDEVGSFTPLLK